MSKTPNMIAAAVVLFNPDCDVCQNILSYADYVDRVYVIDNSDSPNAEIVQKVCEIEKVIYVGNGSNYGQAKALNQACELAISDGYSWLLTMDQDSSFEREAIKGYISSHDRVDNPESVAMIGISFKKKASFDFENYRHCYTLITSGSLLNLVLYQDVGQFNEEYFIDRVDHEYCLRAKRKGHSIVCFEGVWLNHKLGMRKKIGFLSVGLHSPGRLFFRTRNTLLMTKEYLRRFPFVIAKHLWDTAVAILKNVMFAEDKRLMLKNIYDGIIIVIKD